MRLLPRRAGADAQADPAPTADDVRPDAKGRPTPKRRDTGPRRGPVSPAPKNRREAMARQREQLKQSRASGKTTTISARDRRARGMAGDEAYLPRRDAGPVRALARDYVDSHRMIANFLLLLFPISLLSLHWSYFGTVTVALILCVAVEGLYTGRRIVRLAREREIDLGRDRTANMAVYAVMRAYFPRRWRMPRPRVAVGGSF